MKKITLLFLTFFIFDIVIITQAMQQRVPRDRRFARGWRPAEARPEGVPVRGERRCPVRPRRRAGLTPNQLRCVMTIDRQGRQRIRCPRLDILPEQYEIVRMGRPRVRVVRGQRLVFRPVIIQVPAELLPERFQRRLQRRIRRLEQQLDRLRQALE